MWAARPSTFALARRSKYVLRAVGASNRSPGKRSSASPSVPAIAHRCVAPRGQLGAHAISAEGDLREAGTKLAATLGTSLVTASLSDNPGDISVTARKERSLSG